MKAPLHTHPRLIACIALVLASVLCLPIQHEPQQQPFILPAASLIEVPYADWAHHHWVWFHNSQNNQANNTKLVQDYLDRGIKVGVLNIDSGWETGYNSFVFNPAKFPDPKTMIDQFHAQGIKVTTWITSMVNIDSPNFQYCLDNGYFLNNGQLVEWWRGTGAFFDYTHPRGLDYWHGLMKNVLDLGVDGWKTDGTDPYFFLLGPNVRGYSGRVTQEYYAEFYYADFYNYTNVVKGDRQALIMSRPVDTGHSFSPYYVMFSGWVGDQESDFGGLKKALTNMLQSAFRNYLNFGSDIAGYRSSDTIPRTKELLLRWTQLSAFNPLMENGGSGEHRPWMYGDDVSEIYRRFVDIHYSLCTFFLNAGTQAYAAGRSVMMPLGQDLPVPDRFDFVLWHDIFVSPILDYGTQFEVQIPDGRWVDWWDATRVFSGPTTIQYDCPYDRFPVFTRAGAIIPLDLEYNGLYAHDHKGLLTLSVTWPHESAELSLHETRGGGLKVSYQRDGSSLVFSLSAYSSRPIALRIGGPSIRNVSRLWIETADGVESLSGFESMPSISQLRRGWLPFQFDDGEYLVVIVGDVKSGARVSIEGL